MKRATEVAVAGEGNRRDGADSRSLRTLAMVALVLSAAAICVATLTVRSAGGGDGPSGCLLICGPRGLADTIANILLFAPFGFSLGLLRVSGFRALLLGAAFSVGIEVTQVWFIAGRDGNPADVISNGLGALLGAVLGYRWFELLRPGPARARRLLLMAAAGAIASTAATGWLLAPAFPGLDFYGQWTEGHGAYSRYEGEVLAASIGGESISGWEAPVSPGARGLLAEGVPLVVQFKVGPKPERMSLLLAISRGASQLVFIAIEGNDLVAHYYARALDLALDGPSVRLIDGLAEYAPGEEVTLRLRREGSGYCLELGNRVECREFTAGSGWSLIQSVDAYPAPGSNVLNFIWTALFGFPLGLWYYRGRIPAAIVVVALAGVAFMPFLLPLGHPSIVDVAGALAGCVTGYAVRRWAVNRFGKPSTI